MSPLGQHNGHGNIISRFARFPRDWPRTNARVELIDSAGPPPDDVQIQFAVDRNGSREVTSEPMTRAGDMLVARRENIQQSFGFRAEGGDDDTMPWHWVEVVDAPKLESLKMTVHPPAYTGLPARPLKGTWKCLPAAESKSAGSPTKQFSRRELYKPGCRR